MLVVDDEPMVRRVIRTILEHSGYEVLEAGSGEEALEVLQSGVSVNVLVLDQTMPGMGGERTLDAVHEIFPNMPVVRTSGYAVEDRERTGAAPIRVLAKPFGVRQLTESVRAVLDAR